ncbi:MAG: transposase, partial [Bacteroidales bacterium]|nr:transposase [Bacteroidales bacterium]
MINAMMYITKTGCQWRMLPKDFGPICGKACDRAISPSVGLIDSRSVRTSHHIDSSEYGIDGGKKIKGRQEHIIVDTPGLPMTVKVHTANIHDSIGAVEQIEQLWYLFPRLRKVIADCGYRGKLADFVKSLEWELSVVLRSDESSKKFQVLPL